MDQEASAATEVTDTSSQVESQATAERTYTQQEFDDAMAKMKAAERKRALKPYEDLGDPDTLRQLKQEYETRQQEAQVKRGEFDSILKDLASKKDAEIAKRDALIQEYRVDVPLINAAAQFKSVNPEQVRSLLKGSVRLNGDGEVEVIDHNGTVRYGDNGEPLGVNDLVREFLEANPHFVQPNPSTTNSRSSIGNGRDKGLDLSKLDMKNPEHRKMYQEYRKQH
jgi:hypothetical protein